MKTIFTNIQYSVIIYSSVWISCKNSGDTGWDQKKHHNGKKNNIVDRLFYAPGVHVCIQQENYVVNHGTLRSLFTNGAGDNALKGKKV